MKRLTLVMIAISMLAPVSGIALLWPADAPDFAEVKAGFLPSDVYLLDRRGERIGAVRVDFQVRRSEWEALSSISPALIEAAIEGEDRRFWQHRGIDWRSVAGAFRDRMRRTRNRGASTITMQVASLLQGENRGRRGWRAWWRKREQARLARGLEARWSKQQILEAYFNLLHFRGELQGIGATARVLAGKAPAGLSQAESLVIAALLPEPNAKPERVAARACARARGVREVTCESLGVTAATLLSRVQRAVAEEDLAPHLANALVKVDGGKAGEQVRSTLDAGVQRMARDILRRQLRDLGSRNVRDGAVLVVENATGDVLAYVGSAGPQSRAAQVDGVRALRQAGSTLKPFLYQLALERRYVTAASLLKDSPLHLDTASGAYIPQDYDKEFKGLVSVRTALGNSLNIPAVRTLVLTGVEPFRDRLHALGYADVTESGEFYGYALALGSAEVTLWQQAQAYRALARGGAWSPLRVLADEPLMSDAQVLPKDASFIVSDILSDSSARAVTFGLDNHLNTAFWSAVKTGTSKDMRDNWCVGFSSQYTLAVWVGNFEGDSMHDVSGVSGAAPVWREVMSALHENTPSLAPSPPAGIRSVQARFSPAVEAQRQEWIIADGSSSERLAVTRAEPSARIMSPANGMVIAIDPDIPPARQKVAIDIQGAAAGMHLKLDDRDLAPASQLVLWSPQAGAHRLALVDEGGRTVDQILFTVR